MARVQQFAPDAQITASALVWALQRFAWEIRECLASGLCAAARFNSIVFDRVQCQPFLANVSVS